MEMARMPTPTSVQPAPNTSMATLNLSNVPIIGFKTFAATPRTTNTPAKAASPVTTSPIRILPRVLRIGVNAANAIAATKSAADAPKVPFMRFSPPANIPIAPPRVINPLAISVHVIPPMLLRAFPIMAIAVDTPISPIALDIIPLGSKRMAAHMPAIATPIDTSPLAT